MSTDEASAGAARAFMSVKTQFDNLGDALINRELARLVSARALTTVDYSRCPPAFRRTMGLDADQKIRPLVRMGYVRLLARMAASALVGKRCYFFLNPGGLGRRPLTSRQLWAGHLNNLVLRALRALGVKICLVGVSFDPLDPRSLRLAQERASQLDAFVVRDEASAAYLSSVGLHVDAVVQDLSFGLYRTPGPLESASVDNRRKIAFCFRFDGIGQERIQTFVTTVMERLGPGYEYAFVAQVGRDVEPMRSLAAACQTATGLHVEFFACVDDIARIVDFYAYCRTLYSNRLHGLLLAAYGGAAPIGVVDDLRDGKIIGLFKDLGIADRLIPIDDPGDPSEHAVAPLDADVMKVQYDALATYFGELVR